jgi:hypothetical protein
MKSIKLKVFFLALSFFAFSATFAQDTSHKHRPDTSKWPKSDTSKMPRPDTTGVKTTGSESSIAGNTYHVNRPSLTESSGKVAARKEETKN